MERQHKHGEVQDECFQLLAANAPNATKLNWTNKM